MTCSSSARRPFIDWWTGGSWEGMLAAVDAGLAIANTETIIVPGHGPTTDRAGHGGVPRDAAGGGTDRCAMRYSGVNRWRSIVAARPGAGYESSFGSQSRADQFVQLLVVGFSRQSALR